MFGDYNTLMFLQSRVISSRTPLILSQSRYSPIDAQNPLCYTPAMNLWYDLFLILLLLGGIAAGFALGLFRQLVNIGGLIFAFIFASYYQPTVARLARQYMGEDEGFGRDALLFFLVFSSSQRSVWAWVDKELTMVQAH